MTQNQHSEFGTGRGVERMPDGEARPLTNRERVRIERTAGLKGQTLAEVDHQARPNRRRVLQQQLRTVQ